MSELLLAIDQGTSSTRAVAFDRSLRPVAFARRELAVRHPRPGWVEEDPHEILDSVVQSVAEVLERCGGAARIAAVGLDNQGETVVAWDAESGEALAPAIVWQCKRSGPIVERQRLLGREPAIRSRTGLPLDPYFSAGKLTWLLEEVPRVRAARDARTLRLGTVDAWLTWRLVGASLTDTSTASRTQLFDIQALRWDEQLLEWFGVPAWTLPRVVPTTGALALLRHPRWRGELPLAAMVCDQQAALAGHACFDPGDLKATYGTGVFVLANAGQHPPAPRDLLATIAWTLNDGATRYALDGGVFAAGTLITWLREGLGIIARAEEVEPLARSVPNSAGVQILPALAGLGAPWWRPEARGVIAGLTPAASAAHVARAALDGIAHRVCDVVEAMLPHLPAPPGALRVDGGLTANGYLLQRQADLLGLPLDVSATEEATALGTAVLAALGAGLLGIEAARAAAAPARRITPLLAPAERERERERWRRFLAAAAAIPPLDAPSE